jgi:carbonic anhydrase
VHGWVYDIKDGLMNDLQVNARSSEEARSAYRDAVRALSAA